MAKPSTRDLIHAIRRGDRLNHKTMQRIADELEGRDEPLFTEEEIKSGKLPSKLPGCILDGLPTVRDPHHNGANEWCFAYNSFWIRQWYTNERWTKVNKIHATPPRVKALAKLMDMSENK